MDNNKQIAITCSQCGIAKPRAAFLQFDSKKGMSYGRICNTCRSANADAKPAPTDEDAEGHQVADLKNRIDNKAKVQAELEQKKVQAQKEEDKLEYKKKQEEAAEKKATSETEGKENITDERRAERQSSYLDYTSKPAEKSSATAAALETMFQEQEKFANQDRSTNIDKQNEKTAEGEVLRATNVDPNASYTDTIHGDVKQKTGLFEEAKARVAGPWSNLDRQKKQAQTSMLNQAQTNSIFQAQEQKNQKTPPTTQATPPTQEKKAVPTIFQQPQENKTAAADPVVSYVDQYWGPTNRR